MIITGNGNLKLINAPTLKLPDGFESYDPKITESNNSKMFDFLIIPRKEGVFTLNNLDFSYFDLNSKKYITKSGYNYNDYTNYFNNINEYNSNNRSI